ncbi:STAS domain-containing protein [Streptomyces fructofermentans]|uniref:Anti-sigma factor antagonist n=2 Tax=Streptomyces fructofermentans TaxID=152141 RepID=A0A918U1Z6_9ACTN|nr:STAS domain-containing protein [Streptomyces fructofermentans]GGX81058.1 anti-sigma factor antagonist [Streptomyces fructofermentans]
MSPLKITTGYAATGPVLKVLGELDYDNAPELSELVPTIPLRPGQCLVLDLGGMVFCDSSGLSALIAAHRHTQAARADIALAAVPAHTLRILRIVGLDQIFPIHPDTASATAP